jgi:hypothetical protein
LFTKTRRSDGRRPKGTELIRVLNSNFLNLHLIRYVNMFLNPIISKRSPSNPPTTKIKSIENAFPSIRAFRHKISEHNVQPINE